jgi:hypothetical protein
MAYHYLIMSQRDFLKIQSIEEILRERANYYTLENSNQNYWIIMNPLFIKTQKIFQSIKKTIFYSQNQNNTSYVALISTNEAFVDWLRLRIGYFELLNSTNDNPISLKEIKSDGIMGQIEVNLAELSFYFKSTENNLDNIKELSLLE